MKEGSGGRKEVQVGRNKKCRRCRKIGTKDSEGRQRGKGVKKGS